MSYKEQGSKEWKQFRMDYIGASDSSAILNISPWKTRYQLWKEKLGLYETKENDAMRRGKAMEQEAREFYSDQEGEFFVDDVKTKGIFIASLDGINLDKTVAIEIKCPNLKKVGEFFSSRRVPDHYYSQLQHQMYVYDLQEILYAEYHPDLKIPALIVERNDQFLENYIDQATKFWELVQTRTPPELTDKDYIQRNDDEWHRYSQKIVSLKNDIKEFERDFENLKKTLINMSNDQNTKGCGVTVSKSIRSGGIDYDSMPDDLKIEVDKYRKKETEFWTVRIDKE